MMNIFGIACLLTTLTWCFCNLDKIILVTILFLLLGGIVYISIEYGKILVALIIAIVILKLLFFTDKKEIIIENDKEIEQLRLLASQYIDKLFKSGRTVLKKENYTKFRDIVEKENKIEFTKIMTPCQLSDLLYSELYKRLK